MGMQEQRENTLIERIKETMRTNHHPTGEYTWHHQTASLPVTGEDLAQAEAQLCFGLLSFLRRLYLEVGNGGFGPGYGLFPLHDHSPSLAPLTGSLVAAYLGIRSMSQKDTDEDLADDGRNTSLWPQRALTICERGCHIYSCL